MSRPARANLLRKLYGQSACRHLNVLIRSILKPYSRRTKSRTIGGRCEQCRRDVIREMTALEIKTGVRQSEWRLA